MLSPPMRQVHCPLHFVRTTGAAKILEAAAGSREFDVFCNGITLLRDFDIYKEEAGGGHVL